MNTSAPRPLTPSANGFIPAIETTVPILATPPVQDDATQPNLAPPSVLASSAGFTLPLIAQARAETPLSAGEASPADSAPLLSQSSINGLSWIPVFIFMGALLLNKDKPLVDVLVKANPDPSGKGADLPTLLVVATAPLALMSVYWFFLRSPEDTSSGLGFIAGAAGLSLPFVLGAIMRRNGGQ